MVGIHTLKFEPKHTEKILEILGFFHAQDTALGDPRRAGVFKEKVNEYGGYLKGLVKRGKGDVHHLLFEPKELSRGLKHGVRFVSAGGRGSADIFGVGGSYPNMEELMTLYPGIDPLLAAKIGLEHELPNGEKGTIAFAITPDMSNKRNEDIVHHVGVLDADDKLHVVKMHPEELYIKTTSPIDKTLPKGVKKDVVVKQPEDVKLAKPIRPITEEKSRQTVDPIREDLEKWLRQELFPSGEIPEPLNTALKKAETPAQRVDLLHVHQEQSLLDMVESQSKGLRAKLKAEMASLPPSIRITRLKHHYTEQRLLNELGQLPEALEAKMAKLQFPEDRIPLLQAELKKRSGGGKG